MLIKLCICFGICLSSKWFCLILTFFPFLKPWADNGLTNQCSCQLFYGQRGNAPCAILSQNMHIVGKEPGGTPSALRYLSYLISSSLTDIKQLSKN